MTNINTTINNLFAEVKPFCFADHTRLVMKDTTATIVLNISGGREIPLRQYDNKVDMCSFLQSLHQNLRSIKHTRSNLLIKAITKLPQYSATKLSFYFGVTNITLGVHPQTIFNLPHKEAIAYMKGILSQLQSYFIYTPNPTTTTITPENVINGTIIPFSAPTYDAQFYQSNTGHIIPITFHQYNKLIGSLKMHQDRTANSNVNPTFSEILEHIHLY